MLAVRWTIGDVAPRGVAALRGSVWGAGAHFAGLDTRRLGFQFEGRTAEEVRAEHWDALAGEVARRVGL